MAEPEPVEGGGERWSQDRFTLLLARIAEESEGIQDMDAKLIPVVSA
ncbi:hypothetical protein [Streptomyces sp. NPDC029526]